MDKLIDKLIAILDKMEEWLGIIIRFLFQPLMLIMEVMIILILCIFIFACTTVKYTKTLPNGSNVNLKYTFPPLANKGQKVTVNKEEYLYINDKPTTLTILNVNVDSVTDVSPQQEAINIFKQGMDMAK